MRDRDISPGQVYIARVSDRLVPLRVDRTESHCCKRGARRQYHCTNLRTGRTVLVLSAQRFREHVPADQVQARLDVIH